MSKEEGNSPKNPLKKLASQTVVYGLSSIIGRFLNYLLVPLYTYIFPAKEYGVVSEFYAYAGFFSVLLTLGLETGYFRFHNKKDIPQNAAYSASLFCLVIVNAIFFLGMITFQKPISEIARYPQHPEYLVWFSLILVLDTISALPFARLRAEEKAFRFAGIKLTEIFVSIALNVFFLLVWPKVAMQWPGSLLATLYDSTLGVGYIFLANLIASQTKMTLLFPQWKGVSFQEGFPIIRPILAYSLPMVVIGFAGMINEMLDRAILKYLLPGTLEENLRVLGIYGACYKLSILMTLFIQAFRYAGEPFFFAYAGRSDAKYTYALVLNYFVAFCVFIFLLVTLYLEGFQYFIGPEYREGLEIVPILLTANLFLGMYVNLSIWYKLTDKTVLGAWVSAIAAVLTLLLNIWWIPLLGYKGAAWAHLVCYSSMVAVSYLLGRYFYPVPYPMRKIAGYIALGWILYILDQDWVKNCGWNTWTTGSCLLVSYILMVILLNSKNKAIR